MLTPLLTTPFILPFLIRVIRFCPLGFTIRYLNSELYAHYELSSSEIVLLSLALTWYQSRLVRPTIS